MARSARALTEQIYAQRHRQRERERNRAYFGHDSNVFFPFTTSSGYSTRITFVWKWEPAIKNVFIACSLPHRPWLVWVVWSLRQHSAHHYWYIVGRAKRIVRYPGWFHFQLHAGERITRVCSPGSRVLTSCTWYIFREPELSLNVIGYVRCAVCGTWPLSAMRGRYRSYTMYSSIRLGGGSGACHIHHAKSYRTTSYQGIIYSTSTSTR